MTAGVVILIMCVTGGAARVRAADRRLGGDPRVQGRAAVGGDATAAGGSDDRQVQEVEPRSAFTGVTVRAGANSPVALAAGQRTLYVDPDTGRILGEDAPGVRRFFRVVTDWHRMLALSGEQRPTGKATRRVQPRVPLHRRQRHLPLVAEELDARQLRNVTMFNWDLRGKARDFNWHNTIGFWSAIPLFFVVLGATVISYPWASDLAYRVVGEAPPPRQRPAAAAAGPQGGPESPDQSVADLGAADGLAAANDRGQLAGIDNCGRRQSSRWRAGAASTCASRPDPMRRSSSPSIRVMPGSRRSAAR